MTNQTKAGGLYVALLRGINVGGKNKLPMKELAAMFEKAGAGEVRTYIQSGNVLFRATEPDDSRITRAVEQALYNRLGTRVPVVTRSASELRSVISENPFLRAGRDPKRLYVMFLAERPSAARVSTIDPARSPPDELVVRGREIYLCCPSGVARTRLTNDYFDRRLETTSTLRNWRTVRKLVDLTDEAGLGS